MSRNELVEDVARRLDLENTVLVSIRVITSAYGNVFDFLADVKREGVHAVQLNSGNVFCWKPKGELSK